MEFQEARGRGAKQNEWETVFAASGSRLRRARLTRYDFLTRNAFATRCFLGFGGW